MNRQEIAQLLDRYAKGETSPQETLLVDTWLSNPTNDSDIWTGLTAAHREQWLKNTWGDISHAIDGKARVIPIHRKWIVWRAAVGIAASVLIFAGIYWLNRNDDMPASVTAVQTKIKEKKMIILPDSSKVWLNEGSELKYPETFIGKTREVILTGEAYFDIRHDDDHAFIVHTGILNTKVLGTAFNIRESKPTNLVTITVTRGKVSVSEGTKLLGYITPNQQINYHTREKIFEKRNVDASTTIAWQEGDLHFDEITFGDAARILTGRFSKKISFHNPSIASCRFSGTVLTGKNIDQILKVICAFNSATYRYNIDSSIIIDGKGCH